MKHIWAPWRKQYIEQGSPQGCIFCGAVKEKDDKKNRIIRRGKRCFCMLNLYPYNGGHVMVAPYRHVADLKDLEIDELSDLMLMVRDIISLLKDKIKAEGFNVGINLGRVAGAGVEDHIHVHIVPRWNGDTNFMSVIADTKVISQSLDDMYEILTRD